MAGSLAGRPSSRAAGASGPYAAFFGALKLSDEVKLDFDVALTPHG